VRSGWGRWLLVGLAALLPTLISLVVNLATDLPLPAFTDEPWVVWPALAVLTAASVVVAVRSTQPAEAVLPAGRVRLLAGSARLPADPTPLLGRDAELEELRGYLTAWDQPGPRVAVLTGPAGVGKSALAVRLAHRLAGQLGHRPLYADLGGAGAGRSDPGEVLVWFLHALGVADEAIPANAATASCRCWSTPAATR
jgi:hypothetical protein